MSKREEIVLKGSALSREYINKNSSKPCPVKMHSSYLENDLYSGSLKLAPT